MTGEPTIEQLVRAQVDAAIDGALEKVAVMLRAPQPLTFTIGQTAHVLGCSDRHVAKLVTNGTLPLVPHMGTRRLIPRRAVEELVNGRQGSAPSHHQGGDGGGADLSERRSA